MRNLFILLSLTFFTACSSPQEPKEETTAVAEDYITLSAEQYKNAGIETGIVQKHPVNSILRVNGVVDVPPQNIVSVSFPLGGYLKNMRLLPGMQVRKGETIATIEDQAMIQLQQDYLVTKARLEYAEKDYERQETLHKNNVSADKVLQQSKAEYASQKAILRGLEEKLHLVGINPAQLNDRTISRSVAIYSPIHGFVSKVNVNIGKYVNPSDVLFELINPDDIHAVLTVFEKDLAKVKPKQKVMVTFADDPGTEYECEVLLITKNVDDDRRALVHCHFEKRPGLLLPGMFLNAAIHVNNTAVTAVPEEALVRYGKNSYLLEETGGNRFTLLPVIPGVTDNGMTEVSSGEDSLEGKKIITRNAYPVLAMMKNNGEED
ncbi:MAG: efflux RND transporter periplasmic adaptor subunit [Chitinophagaceae bacterium]|nr:efflux RND transporter periplasmic adaptor subunit [Chitinophagaceae bacterium]MCW5927910.1 efflux RND transporter periplasmic adaptor subunit [Chitinophagaceae bacterium]